jgi:uncharacterized protein GlcG (DUF336 family)
LSTGRFHFHLSEDRMKLNLCAISLAVAKASAHADSACQSLPGAGQLRTLLLQAAVWPGSQAIARSKAYTANAFSLESSALSTARLYTFTQPGHSLWSLFGSNAFDPRLLAPATHGDDGDNRIPGGMIFFGGGVPLYRNGKIVGALGVSGDTSCADHEIAKRVRALAQLAPTHPGGNRVEDVTCSVPDGASAFTRPRCVAAYRNGLPIGEEQPAPGH